MPNTAYNFIYIITLCLLLGFTIYNKSYTFQDGVSEIVQRSTTFVMCVNSSRPENLIILTDIYSANIYIYRDPALLLFASIKSCSLCNFGVS